MFMNGWVSGGVRNIRSEVVDGPRTTPFLTTSQVESNDSVATLNTGNTIECARKKVIGKPYEGEPHVRFDEGELVVKSLKYSTTWNQ